MEDSMNEAFKATRETPLPSDGVSAEPPGHFRSGSSRDDFPDYSERAFRLGDLIAAPALPLIEIALFLDLPISTIDKLRAQGKGPRTFKIGRRLYVRQVDLREWIDRMADTEAA
jgi:hypothetical protein